MSLNHNAPAFIPQVQGEDVTGSKARCWTDYCDANVPVVDANILNTVVATCPPKPKRFAVISIAANSYLRKHLQYATASLDMSMLIGYLDFDAWISLPNKDCVIFWAIAEIDPEALKCNNPITVPYNEMTVLAMC